MFSYINPNQNFVSDFQTKLSYEELNDKVQKLANLLLEKGLPIGGFVAIVIEKSIEAVIGILAVLRIGGCYVPIDKDIPSQRMLDILYDCNPQIILTNNDSVHLLNNEYKNKALLINEEIDKYQDNKNRSRQPNELDPAYCLYTSGSSGTPKGVLIPYRALKAFFINIDLLMKINKNSKCLNTSSLHFDVSILDILYPIYKGACLFISPSMFLPQLILNTIQSEKITHICLVSSKLDNIVRNNHVFSKYDINSLKVIMTGAEVVKEETIKRVLLQNAKLSIINGYGPTEATCVCIAFSITSKIKACNGSYPIGQPLKNVEVKFLSDSGDINDTCGEILINSSQLFIGYLNKLSITQNSFVERAGRKYYKTGDMGIVDGNKQINFIGRKDDLIKFRGYRVEKQEICNAIFKVFPMAEAYVYCTEDDSYKQNLVVAISDPDFNESDEHQLIQNLKMVLPSYMIPSRIICFDAFPKLNSGKIDKKTLERNIILKI